MMNRMNLGSYTEFGTEEVCRRVTWTKMFALLPRYQQSDDPNPKRLWLKRIYRCTVQGYGSYKYESNHYYSLEDGVMEMLKGTHA